MRLKAGNLIIVLLILLLVAPAARADLLLNEFLSNNCSGVEDEDGDREDWLELINTGPEAFDLTGCRLSDDPAEPFKWLLPELSLPADGHLLIFASDKDRRIGAFAWETIIDWGDAWRYRVNFDAAPAGWHEGGFDDSAWEIGASGFGRGDGDDATELPECISFCLRIPFSIPEPELLRLLVLHMDYDDGFVAWINGVEVARAGVSGSGVPPWNQTAASSHEALIYQGLPPETFAVTDLAPLQLAGENVLAIQVHNKSFDSDMTAIPFLTLGLDDHPASGNGPAELLAAFLPVPHCNFKLASQGETVLLVDAAGGLLDIKVVGPLDRDISLGRAPGAPDDWLYFLLPTPGAANGENGLPGFASPPEFSPSKGIYSTAQTVTLSSPDPGAEIHYTLNGSLPSQLSPPYDEPIQLDAPATFRARAYVPGWHPSPEVFASFIIGEDTELPVTCFTTDPYNLWDEDYGIFAGENYWEDWERPVHVEFFEADGSLAVDQGAGLRVFGGYTRTFPQKSLHLTADDFYGPSLFEHDFFTERSFDEFEELVWRNGGNDWNKAMFRDGLMHRITAPADLDRLAFRPTRSYLNGEFWGIYNIREHIDADYLASNRDVDAEELDLIKNYWTVKAGSRVHYDEMIAYIEEHDLGEDAHYAWVGEQMIIEQYVDYMLFEIFFGNTDWPGNNIAWWRPWDDDDRWRWILYDTDFGLGGNNNYTHNTLAFALEEDGPVWPNPPHSTFLLRNLLLNEIFRNLFVASYCDRLNSCLLPEITRPLAAGFAAAISADIEDHFLRWDLGFSNWIASVTNIDSYLLLRPHYARQHLAGELGLGETCVLHLDISPAWAGRIELAAISVDSAWSGIYFEGLPLRLGARPAPGFIFRGWTGGELPGEADIELILEGDLQLTAEFTFNAVPGSAVINEINYNSAADFDPGDWIELHNPGDEDLDLTGWIFRDEDDEHGYIMPIGSLLSAGRFLVLCSDSTAFAALFPDAPRLPGQLDFGFSGGGELLRLFDAVGEIHDQVLYDDAPPWPPEADGDGPTLELLGSELDNALPSSWVASHGHGSPGEVNSCQLTAAGAGAPPSTHLLPAYPNPFNPATTIHFSLARHGRVLVRVFDTRGRQVARLADGLFQAGEHSLTWRGRSDRGGRLSSGLYLVLVESGDWRAVQRLVLLK